MFSVIAAAVRNPTYMSEKEVLDVSETKKNMCSKTLKKGHKMGTLNENGWSIEMLAMWLLPYSI